MWKKDADRVLEPDVSAFSYNAFDRAPELIEIGDRPRALSSRNCARF